MLDGAGTVIQCGCADVEVTAGREAATLAVVQHGGCTDLQRRAVGCENISAAIE